jgi:HD-GYP domain-containing protein (c-di-GMP phosphodiesterase class II)
VKLIPFSAQYLRLNEALPFGVRDAQGKLLLSAGQVIASGAQLQQLHAQPLFAGEEESAEWRRRLSAALDAAIRRNEQIGEIAQARPAEDKAAAEEKKSLSVPEQWLQFAMQLDAALRAQEDPAGQADWLDRVRQVQAQAQPLGASKADASLYWLIFNAGQHATKYSCQHALLVMLVCDRAAEVLGWPAGRRQDLALAALTMNVSMLRLQDLLATAERRPTEEERLQIQAHPQTGAEQLARVGASEDVCKVVAQHHRIELPEGAFMDWPRVAQMAQLLRRVDVFTAKLSARKGRSPMSPMQAAREACLGANGQPDEIGAALLKALGIYPPGCFVQLDCGELGIVVSRGRRANLPIVASLVNASGIPLGEPALRDTVHRKFSVKAAVPPASVKVRPPHARLLAMV